MGHALEMVKKKRGLNMPPGEGDTKPRDPIQELEDAIVQEQDFAKRQALARQLRELTAQHELQRREETLQSEIRVKDLEDRLRRGGKMVDDTDPDKQQVAEREKKAAEEKKQLMTQAKSLIDSGMPPQQVGQMLMGLPVTAASAGVPTQGMSMSDALKLVDVIIEKKTEGELRASIVSLQREIDTLKKGGGGVTSTPQSPIAYAKEQASAAKAWIDALKDMGVPVGEAAKGGEGEGIESLKEKNRHDEEMERLKTEKSYKESIATSLGDVVERVGRGAAHQFMEQGETEEPAGAKLGYFTCKEVKDGVECGTQVLIPPGATEFTCPKCLSIYGPKQK